MPGLATGADSLDQFLTKLKIMIAELLELNDVPFMGNEVEFELAVHCRTAYPLPA